MPPEGGDAGTLETKDDKQMKLAHYKTNISLSNIQYNLPP